MSSSQPFVAERSRARPAAASHIRRDTRLTARLDEFRAKLEDIHAKRRREFMTFRDRVLDLIKGFKDNCQQLSLEEEQCLNQLKGMDFTSFDMSSLQSALKDCQKGVPERVKFAKNGLVVSFEPEPDHSTRSFTDPVPDRPAPSPPSLSPAIRDQSHQTVTQPIPSNPSAPRQRQPSPPLLPPARPGSSKSSTITPPAPAHSPTHLPAHALADTKQKGQVKPSHVRKGKYWVFEHTSNNARRSNMYILRCPNTSCQQPVFSKHPFRQNRAPEHFKACRVPFKNNADIVKRYAQLVVQERRSRPLTREWCKKHNATLIGGLEGWLHAENIWPGID